MSLEIEIPVAELKQVLPGFNKIIPKSALPVLGCLKATVENGEVKLQATNFDDTATVSMGRCGNGNGSMLVPYEELNKVVKGCAATDMIRLSAKTNEATINYPIGSSRVDRKLSFTDPKDWPETTTEINEPSIPVDGTLKEALQHALDCSSDDSSRYVLQSAFLDMRDPKANYVVGTNGHVIFSANSFHFGMKDSLIVPNRKFLHWKGFMDVDTWALSSLAPVKAVPGARGKNAVEERPGYVQFKSDRWTFITRQIEGNYPNWKQAVPAEFKTTVKLSAEAIKFIADVVPKMPCADSTYLTIYLVVEAGTLSLVANAHRNDPWTKLQVSGAVVDGSAVTVAINRTFLAKAMELGLDEIALIDTLSPVLFRKDGRRLLVSPLRPEGSPTAPTPAVKKVETVPANAQPDQAIEPPPVNEVPAIQPSESTSAPATTAENQERTTIMPEEPQQQAKSAKTEKPQSAYDQLQDMVERTRTTLKGVVSDLNDLSKTVSQAYREKRATEREIDSIRQSLNEIRRMKI